MSAPSSCRWRSRAARMAAAHVRKFGGCAAKRFTDRGMNNAMPPLHETRINTAHFGGAVSHYLCRDVYFQLRRISKRLQRREPRR